MDGSPAGSGGDAGEPRSPNCGLTRRSLFKAGAVAAVGTTAVATAASSSAEEIESPLTAATLGTVDAVDSGSLRISVEAGSRAVDVASLDDAAQQYGEGVRTQPDAHTVDVSVAGSDGFWQPGHRAVLIEQYSDDGWNTIAVQHLFVPIDPQKVSDRDGSTLTTSDAVVEITNASKPAPQPWDDTTTVPLGEIGAGDTIGGLGYLSPSKDKIQAAAVGVTSET